MNSYNYLQLLNLVKNLMTFKRDKVSFMISINLNVSRKLWIKDVEDDDED